ncbi:MAG: LamG domain-containing protein [Solirubrobacteraceae bacterium]
MHARWGLVALVVALGAIIPSSASAATNLGAFWHLDESSGTVAADSSGNGNHGAINGATSIAGRFGRSLNFDGDDSVFVTRSASLEPENITVEGWVRAPASPGPFRHIVSEGAATCNGASYGLYTGFGGGLAFYISDGVSFTVSPEAGTDVWDGAWHHVAGMFDGDTVRLYFDGTEVGSGSPTGLAIVYGLPTSADGLLGAYGGDPCAGVSHSYVGDLDEPRVWHRAMSSTEIAASAAMGGASTSRFGQSIETNQAITYTSDFDGQTVNISTESSTGTEQIDRVTLVGILPLTSGATCSGGLLSILNSNCTMTRSNENRTARVTVRPLLGHPTVTLRVRMKSNRTFNVTVDTG